MAVGSFAPRSVSGGPKSKGRSPTRRRCMLSDIQVLGAEALRTKDVRATHRCVINHIAAVRKIKGLERCTIVLNLESNLAFESQHILHSLNEHKVRNWVALSEGQGGTIGWLTTNERKESMCAAPLFLVAPPRNKFASHPQVLPTPRRPPRRLHHAPPRLLLGQHRRGRSAKSARRRAAQLLHRDRAAQDAFRQRCTPEISQTPQFLLTQPSAQCAKSTPASSAAATMTSQSLYSWPSPVAAVSTHRKSTRPFVPSTDDPDPDKRLRRIGDDDELECVLLCCGRVWLCVACLYAMLPCVRFV